MAILFPNFPRSTTTKISLKSSTVDLTPFLGGPTQRVSRMADRWVYEVEMRAMRADQAGPIINALLQGLTQTVAVTVFDGTDLTAYSNGTVATAATGGNTIVHSGGGPTKFVGQFVSLIKNNKRYLHKIIAVSGSTLTVLPSLKVATSVGDVLEFGAPKIEGFIDGQEQAWSVGLVSNIGVGFKIVEAY